MPWDLNGNNLGATLTEWLGTRDAQPLIIGTETGGTGLPTATTEAMRITAAADGRRVSIGTPTPRAKLTVAGGGAIVNGVAVGTDVPGIIDYPLEYETVGVTQTNFNLRLQSPNAIVFHTGDTLTDRMLLSEDGDLYIRKFPPNDTTQSNARLTLTNRGAGGIEVSWSLYTAAVGGGFGVNPNAFEIWEYPAIRTRFQIRQGGDTYLAPAGGNVLLPNAEAGRNGNLYFGGRTDAGQTGLRLFGGLVNNSIPAGFIDVRTTDPNDGLRIRVDTGFGGTEQMRVTANGDITWGNNSRLQTDQGGSIELGADRNTVGTGSPYIDFHRQGRPAEDFNTRIQNDADGQLTIRARNGAPPPPGFRLDVWGPAHASSFPTSSDARLKTNVKQLTNVLDKLEKIRAVSFQWNELCESLGRSTGRTEIGVIGQEVEAVFPELVTAWGDENYEAVDYGRLTGILIEAVKELKAQNEALRSRIEALERA